jgi:hypothetical protein
MAAAEVASFRGDFEGAGVSEDLIGRVEEMLMDHYYRVEASVFKVECGLTAQAKQCEEQQQYMHSVSERLSHVAATQTLDRVRLQEMGKDFERCKQSELPPAAALSAKPKVGAAEPLDTATQDRLLLDLRMDFDQQMARHEDRFACLDAALQHSGVELAALRADLAVSACSEMSRPCAAATAPVTSLSGADSGSAVDASSGACALETEIPGSRYELPVTDADWMREAGATTEATGGLRRLAKDSLNGDQSATRNQNSLHHGCTQSVVQAA